MNGRDEATVLKQERLKRKKKMEVFGIFLVIVHRISYFPSLLVSLSLSVSLSLCVLLSFIVLFGEYSKVCLVFFIRENIRIR